MAALVPTSALRSVDFPTFDLPAMVMTPTFGIRYGGEQILSGICIACYDGCGSFLYASGDARDARSVG